MNNNEQKALVTEDRVDDVTEVGLIDGGIWTDVLAICYGDNDRHVRVRFEQTNECWMYAVPEGVLLEDMLKSMANVLDTLFPYITKPEVVVHRGAQARRWVKQMLKSVNEMNTVGEKGKVCVSSDVPPHSGSF